MRVYLAGGINGLSDADANNWRTEVRSALPTRIGVLDPMSRDYRGAEDQNAREIVEGDLADIDACGAMIAHCPRPSWGTAMEIHYAATTGRRVVAIAPDGVPVSPWLRHHTDAIVPTVRGAVDVVLGWSK